MRDDNGGIFSRRRVREIARNHAGFAFEFYVCSDGPALALRAGAVASARRAAEQRAGRGDAAGDAHAFHHELAAADSAVAIVFNQRFQLLAHCFPPSMDRRFTAPIRSTLVLES